MELSNAVRNKLHSHDRPFHDWYRFVLSYPAHLVRQYIDEFQLGGDDLLLDPFCGTGTTVVEGKLSGVKSLGLEANRFAHFAGSTKIKWNVEPDDMVAVATDIASRVISALNKRGLADEPHKHVVVLPELLKTLSPEQEHLILRGSISPVPLHKALTLLQEIDRFRHTSYFDHLRLAFANVLVFKVSNLRFGPEVGVGRARHDVRVVGEWLDEVVRFAEDLRSIEGKEFPDAEIKLADSRDASSVLSPRSISAVITSPPYPNEKDYTRTTRLESVVLGFVSGREDLRDMKRTLLRSNTRGVYKGDDDDEYIRSIPEVDQLANEIEAKRIELGKTSGFERMYPRVTRLYFGGMAKHLSELSVALKPGAMLAYVVGDQASYLRVMIRTGQLLAKIGESLGYEAIRIDQFRTRFSTATKSDLNEEVVILRWSKK
jgi:hypothetical protein